MLINCRNARGFESLFFRMLYFHWKEVKLRCLYFFCSVLLTFFILYWFKNQIFFLIAPFNLCYVNFLDVFWYFIYFALWLSVIFNIPLLLSNLLFFFKNALLEQEYYYLKAYFQVLFFSLLFSLCLLFVCILPWLVQFSYYFNSEQISMQINFTDFIDTVTRCFKWLVIGLNAPTFFILFRIKRINFYLVLITFIVLISPPDFITVCFLIILIIFLCELQYFLFYCFKTTVKQDNGLA